MLKYYPSLLGPPNAIRVTEHSHTFVYNPTQSLEDPMPEPLIVGPEPLSHGNSAGFGDIRPGDTGLIGGDNSVTLSDPGGPELVAGLGKNRTGGTKFDVVDPIADVFTVGAKIDGDQVIIDFTDSITCVDDQGNYVRDHHIYRGGRRVLRPADTGELGPDATRTNAVFQALELPGIEAAHVTGWRQVTAIFGSVFLDDPDKQRRLMELMRESLGRAIEPWLSDRRRDNPRKIKWIEALEL